MKRTATCLAAAAGLALPVGIYLFVTGLGAGGGDVEWKVLSGLALVPLSLPAALVALLLAHLHRRRTSEGGRTVAFAGLVAGLLVLPYVGVAAVVYQFLFTDWFVF